MKDHWLSEWREEEKWRLEEDEGEYDPEWYPYPKPHPHLILSEPRRLEKQFGPRWVCKWCGTEYRVKTPFHRLYCSECLSALRCRRLFPKDDVEPGNWIMDDDLRGLRR